MRTGKCGRVPSEPVEYNIIHEEIELYVSNWITIYAVKKTHEKNVYSKPCSSQSRKFSMIANKKYGFIVCDFLIGIYDKTAKRG